LGDFPPGKTDPRLLWQVITTLVKAHAAAYQVIHELQPKAQVGLAHQYRGFEPAKSWFPLDRWLAKLFTRTFNNAFPGALQTGTLRLLGARQRIPAAKGTQDFMGINYYTREQIAFSLLHPGTLFGRRSFAPGADLSPTGFIANEPAGLFQAIQWGLRFNLPIYITENGVEDPQDRFRPRYLAQHIHQMWRAVNYTWPVRGYYHWTLVDNFEWERGWSQRFGLWELDPITQTRQKRPSAELYEAICRQNGLSSEMAARYAPEIFDKLFPN
jgi:beta-glucosidase